MAMCETNICVPDLCTFFDPPSPFECLYIKETVITGNLFYQLSDIVYQETVKIFAGTGDTISNSVNDWYIGNIIAYYLPFTIIITLIIIICILKGLFSLTIGVLLIVIFLLMVFLSVVYIFINTTNLTTQLPATLKNDVITKYNENLPDIICAIRNTLKPDPTITCLTEDT